MYDSTPKKHGGEDNKKLGGVLRDMMDNRLETKMSAM